MKANRQEYYIELLSFSPSPLKGRVSNDFALFTHFKQRKQKLNGGNPMSLIERDSILTTHEASEYLRISKPTFLKLIRVGRLRAIKAGKGYRILQSELYRFLNGKTEFDADQDCRVKILPDRTIEDL